MHWLVRREKHMEELDKIWCQNGTQKIKFNFSTSKSLREQTGLVSKNSQEDSDPNVQFAWGWLVPYNWYPEWQTYVTLSPMK